MSNEIVVVSYYAARKLILHPFFHAQTFKMTRNNKKSLQYHKMIHLSLSCSFELRKYIFCFKNVRNTRFLKLYRTYYKFTAVNISIDAFCSPLHLL